MIRKEQKRTLNSLCFAASVVQMGDAVPLVDEIDLSDERSFQSVLDFLVSFSLFK